MATLADFSGYMDAARQALNDRDAQEFTLQVNLAKTVAAELADRGDVDGVSFGHRRIEALEALEKSAASVFGSDVVMSSVEFGSQVSRSYYGGWPL